jgi:hypothetical protein
MARLLGHIPVNAQIARMDSRPDQKSFSNPEPQLAQQFDLLAA